MPKENHDSIEQFFKKALSHEDKTFMEQDWNKLEKMLDDQKEPVVGFFSLKGYRWIVPVIGLLLIGSIGYWFYGRSVNKQSLELQAAEGKVVPQSNEREKARDASLHSLPQKSVQSERDSEPSQTLSLKSDFESKNLKDKSSVNRAVQADFDNLNRQRSSQKSYKTKRPPEAEIKLGSAEKALSSKTSSQSVNLTSGETATLNETTDVNVFKLLSSEERESKSSWPVSSERSLDNTVLSNDFSTNQSITEYQNLPSTGEVEIVDSIRSNKRAKIQADSMSIKKDTDEALTTPRRWSISALIGPEFSTTGFDKLTSPGSAYGLLVSFKVLPRLSIRSGWIKTHKKYEGKGSDYQPPAGYWQYKTNGVVPNEIYGTCSVNEVPIFIQYDVAQLAKSKLYLSAGVSNYRMTSESYSYRFYQENPGAASGWSSNVPSSYRFAVGHFSIGYERALSKHVSFAAEPFLKAPFGGIGWSNVSLYTTGIYFSARYTFHRKVKAERSD